MRKVRKPPVRIKPEKRAEIVRLLKEGRSLRYIQFTVGCAPNTANLIRRKENIERPVCGCGRKGGHKGVCFAQREALPKDRPHVPKRFSVDPAKTHLGKLLDQELISRDWSPTMLARRAGMTGLRMTQIRRGTTFLVIVLPADVDRLADAVKAGDRLRFQMHRAAALDIGYKLPPPEEPAKPKGFSMLDGRVPGAGGAKWRRLDLV